MGARMVFADTPTAPMLRGGPPPGTPAHPAQAPYAARPLSAARVCKAAQRGFKALSTTRDIFAFAVKQFAGPWYGRCPDADARPWTEKRPVNLLSQMVEVYLANLVGSGHRPACKPKRLGRRGSALLRRRMLEHWRDEVNLHRLHRRVVQQTLLGGLGVWFTGLRAGSDLILVDGELRDPGQFFALPISLGDVTRDPDSRDPDEDEFFGHRARINRALALETGVGDPDVLMKLETIGHGREEADGTAPPRSSGGSDDRLNDVVEAWNLTLWDGSRTLECVVPSLDGCEDFLIEPREYEGPERGPYELLALRDVPGGTTPIGPAQRLMDLHLAIASVSTMITNQILETDRKLMTRAGNEEQANDLMDKSKRLVVGDPDASREYTIGGLVDKMLPGLATLLGMASNEGLNLQQTAGNKSAAETAAEASILAGRANVILQEAKGACGSALANIYKRCSWWMDQDEFRRVVVTERLSGGESVELLFDADTREGTYAEYEYAIEVEDDLPIDPAMDQKRFIDLCAMLPGMVIQIQQSGGDPTPLLRAVAEEFRRPEIDEIWTTPAAVAEDQAVGMLQGQRTPPVGVRGPARGGRPSFESFTNLVRSDYAE